MQHPNVINNHTKCKQKARFRQENNKLVFTYPKLSKDVVSQIDVDKYSNHQRILESYFYKLLQHKLSLSKIEQVKTIVESGRTCLCLEKGNFVLHGRLEHVKELFIQEVNVQ